MNKSIFQFGFIPKYKKTTINYSKATFKNIARSFVVNKMRFLGRFFRYKRTFRKCTMEELATITSLIRPGKLESLGEV